MSDRTKRRIRLFNEDPRCSFCREATTITMASPHQSQPQNLAVLFSIVNEKGVPATVLACLKCATKRNNEKQAALGIDELRARSSPQGKCLCPNCGNTHFRTVQA